LTSMSSNTQKPNNSAARGRGRGAPRGRGRGGAGRAGPSFVPATFATSSTTSTKQVVSVTCLLDQTQKDYLERVFPGVTFEPTPTATKHTHPISMIERQQAEAEAYKKISRCEKIVDIGGNPARHCGASRNNVHSCCPLLTPEDHAREGSRRLDSRGLKYCNHRFQDCTCVVPDAYLAVHSIYYLTPEDVLCAVFRANKNVLVSAHHMFRAPKGSFAAGEAEWDVSDGSVTMSVMGNLVPYSHRSTEWLSAGYYDNGVKAISWSCIRVVGDTELFLFSPAAIGLASVVVDRGTLTLQEAVQQHNAVGLIDHRGALARDTRIGYNYDEYLSEQCRYYSVAGFIIGYVRSPKPLVLPKEAISAVAFQIAFKPRDKDTFQLAVGHARNVLRRLNLAPVEEQSALAPVAVLGFVLNANVEANTLAAAYHTHRDDFSRLSTVLKGVVPGTVLRRSLVVAGGLLGAVAGVYALKMVWQASVYRAAARLVPAKLASSLPAQVASIAFLVGKKAYRAFISTGWPEWVQTASAHITLWAGRTVRLLRQYVWYSVQKSVEIHAPLSFEDVCCDGRTLGPLHSSAKVFRPLEDRCRPGHGLTQFGPGLRIKPVVARSCAHNELIAIWNRACMDRDDPHPDAFPRLYSWLYPALRPPHTSYWLDMGSLPPTPSNVWLARFPGPKRKHLQTGLDNVRNGDYGQHPWQSKAFVKKEPTLRANELAPQPDFDPRVIQSRTPEYQALIGPWTHRFSKYLAQSWGPVSGIFGYVTYFSGYTAEGMGSWYAQATMFYPFVILLGDFSRWDARLGVAAKLTELKVFVSFRPPRRCAHALAQQALTKGVSRAGVTYVVTATQNSGVSNTSCGNTVLNLGSHCEGLERLGVPRDQYMVAGGGDDAIAIVPEYYGKQLVSLVQLFPDYGFVYEQSVTRSIYRAEVYSGRFWPVLGGGWVYGPKIGRVLAKTFYSLKCYKLERGLAWVRGVALGMMRDVAFIPVLRVLFRRVLELTAEVTPMEVVSKHKIHSADWHEADDRTWEMMDDVYGLDRGQVESLEGFILTMGSVCCTLIHPFLDVLLAVDVPDVMASVFVRLLPGVLLNCVVAPLIEEWLKRQWRWCPLVLGLLELFIDPCPGRILNLFNHLVWARMPYWEGVLAHSVWNLAAGFMPR
jgi:hypothetical protein